jgi:hypothetical protein
MQGFFDECKQHHCCCQLDSCRHRSRGRGRIATGEFCDRAYSEHANHRTVADATTNHESDSIAFTDPGVHGETYYVTLIRSTARTLAGRGSAVVAVVIVVAVWL